jgi:hypothetical protein
MVQDFIKSGFEMTWFAGQQILGLLTYKSGTKKRGVEKGTIGLERRPGCVGDGNRDVGGDEGWKGVGGVASGWVLVWRGH